MTYQTASSSKDVPPTSDVASRSTFINTTHTDIAFAIKAICTDMVKKREEIRSPKLIKSIQNPEKIITNLKNLIPTSFFTRSKEENDFLNIGKKLSNTHLQTLACCMIYLGKHCPKKFADAETTEGELNTFLQNASIQYTTLCLGKDPGALLSTRSRTSCFFGSSSRSRARSTPTVPRPHKGIKNYRPHTNSNGIYFPSSDCRKKYICKKNTLFSRITKALSKAMNPLPNQNKC